MVGVSGVASGFWNLGERSCKNDMANYLAIPGLNKAGRIEFCLKDGRSGRISTTLIFQASVVGAVLLIVTDVPAGEVRRIRRCIQWSTESLASRVSLTITWPVPTVCAVLLVVVKPTPHTQELPRVVVTLTLGALEAPLPVPVAPTAAEPLVPLKSAPVILTTVMETSLVALLALVIVAPTRAGPV